MISSRPQSLSQPANKSSAISREKIASSTQERLSFGAESPLSGSYDDSSLVRGVLIEAIKNSGKSREVIAEEMSYLLARTITASMLNAFTADSRDDRRFPAAFDRAFCRATGDDTLLACRCKAAGLHVIGEEERLLLDLGRQHLIRTQADERIALLEHRLHGRVA